MTFRQLDAFRALMLTGTVTGAAQMLGISQPAMSRLIADFEEEVQLRLFNRTGRRLVPTSEARALFEEVRRAFAGLDRIREAAEAIRAYKHERLRVVAIPSIGAGAGVELVRRFAETHPNVSISLEIQATNGVIDLITAQQADVAIAHPYIETANVNSRVLDSGPSVCLLPVGHPLARAEVIRPQDLRGESYISFRPDSVYRHRIDSLFREAGISRDMRFEVRTTEGVCAMVAAGLGVAIVGPYLPDQAVVGCVVRPFEPVVLVELALIWYANQPLSAIAEEFLAMVERHFLDEQVQVSVGA